LTDHKLEAKRTSIHEASHAVLGFCLGRNIREVTITPARDGSLGRCEFEFDPAVHYDDKASVECAESFVMIHQAGALGECQQFGSWDVQDSELDWRAALDCALIITGGDVVRAKVLQQEARGTAQSLLLLQWPAVQAVAAALLERGTLTGSEFRMIFSAVQFAPISTPPVPPPRAAKAGK
jgi:hypothetical protein